eukprot:TRINITY_DN3553_c0_g2_i2.p1 TRINITY_DN3553_c0_g2~~TRINITY_DN3553_c0_g2_i2.p1  ORF type:complete len:1352 (+),score=427.65 TRINITY_DN3553_c0_g2_i2:374-4429(+)
MMQRKRSLDNISRDASVQFQDPSILIASSASPLSRRPKCTDESVSFIEIFGDFEKLDENEKKNLSTDVKTIIPSDKEWGNLNLAPSKTSYVAEGAVYSPISVQEEEKLLSNADASYISYNSNRLPAAMRLGKLNLLPFPPRNSNNIAQNQFYERSKSGGTRKFDFRRSKSSDQNSRSRKILEGFKETLRPNSNSNPPAINSKDQKQSSNNELENRKKSEKNVVVEGKASKNGEKTQGKGERKAPLKERSHSLLHTLPLSTSMSSIPTELHSFESPETKRSGNQIYESPYDEIEFPSSPRHENRDKISMPLTEDEDHTENNYEETEKKTKIARNEKIEKGYGSKEGNTDGYADSIENLLRLEPNESNFIEGKGGDIQMEDYVDNKMNAVHDGYSDRIVIGARKRFNSKELNSHLTIPYSSNLKDDDSEKDEAYSVDIEIVPKKENDEDVIEKKGVYTDEVDSMSDSSMNSPRSSTNSSPNPSKITKMKSFNQLVMSLEEEMTDIRSSSEASDEDIEGERVVPNKELWVSDWNEEFQSLLEMATTNPEETIDRNSKINQLSEKFLSVAVPLVETIVREKYLKDSERTIPSVHIGGIAGGTKYVSHNIFFKFAKDTSEGMYGGKEWAMKAAGHELKSLISLISCQVPKLHFPFMSLVNFLGQRVICISLLPINYDTLVYGSDNGGMTVNQSSATMNGVMKKIGESLYLKEHVVKNVKICGPVDCEGHQGLDGRHYLVDVSRLFPPSFIPQRPQKVHGSIWYRLLRPEFMKKYKKPLSSDAFSVMGHDGQKVHNREVVQATLFLEKKVIPKVAQELDEWFATQLFSFSHSDPALLSESCKNILTLMHRAGVNYRYLFLILYNVQDPELRNVLVVEMIARVVRKLIWAAMRKLSSDSDVKLFIFGFMNAMYGHDDGDMQETLLKETERRFILATTEDELERNKLYLKKMLKITTKGQKLLLLFRIEELAGIRIVPLGPNPDLLRLYLWKEEMTEENADIKWVATTKVIECSTYESHTTMEEMIEFYKSELAGKIELLGRNHPQIANTRTHLARLYMASGIEFFESAEDQLLQVLEIKLKHFGEFNLEVALAYEQLAQLCREHSRYEMAERFLEKSLEIKGKILRDGHPSTAKTYDQLAQVYRKEGQYDRAEFLFKQALQTLEKALGMDDPIVALTECNLALVYRQTGEFQKADDLYQKALGTVRSVLGPNHSWTSRVEGNMAQNYVLQGKYEEAEGLLNHCVAAKMRSLGENHLDTATALYQLATLYKRSKRYDHAVETYEKALKTRINLLGSRHESVGKILMNIAEIKWEEGNEKESRRLYHEAINILKSAIGESHPYVAQVQQKFSKIFNESSQ